MSGDKHSARFSLFHEHGRGRVKTVLGYVHINNTFASYLNGGFDHRTCIRWEHDFLLRQKRKDLCDGCSTGWSEKNMLSACQSSQRVA